MEQKPEIMEKKPKRGIFMEKDRHSRRSLQSEISRHWFPPVAETSFVWLNFMGKSVWRKGYWVYHPQTSYLNFEAVEAGELTLHYGGQRHLIPAGSAVVIPPGESKLSADSAEGCRKHALGISGLILNSHLTGMNLNKVCVLRDFHSPEFEQLFDSLWQMTEEKRPETVREYAAKVYQLLLLLSHCAVQNPYPEELQRAISFISRNFSRQMSLADICAHAYCGRSTLQWQFKHHLNSSPIRYLTETRMKHAAKLLENTLFPVKEIALRSGCSDQLYFSNTFRKYHGLSPREYRKSRCLPA